jgi:hypothetical protein
MVSTRRSSLRVSRTETLAHGLVKSKFGTTMPRGGKSPRSRTAPTCRAIGPRCRGAQRPWSRSWSCSCGDASVHTGDGRGDWSAIARTTSRGRNVRRGGGFGRPGCNGRRRMAGVLARGRDRLAHLAVPRAPSAPSAWYSGTEVHSRMGSRLLVAHPVREPLEALPGDQGAVGCERPGKGDRRLAREQVFAPCAGGGARSWSPGPSPAFLADGAGDDRRAHLPRLRVVRQGPCVDHRGNPRDGDRTRD